MFICPNRPQLTSIKLRNVMMSRGKCFRRFLCKYNDFKLDSMAILAGILSIALSFTIKACRLTKLPTDSGTSTRRLPGSESTIKLRILHTSLGIVWMEFPPGTKFNYNTRNLQQILAPHPDRGTSAVAVPVIALGSVQINCLQSLTREKRRF